MSLQKIQSELKAPKGQMNKFGNYKYRSCEDIVEAVKPILKDHSASLTISDDIVIVGDRYYVKATAVIKIEGGEVYSTTAFAREPLAKKGMDEAQITGSTSSYARKYALNGLLAIDDTKDPDTMDNSQSNQKKVTKASLTTIETKAIDELFRLCESSDGVGAYQVWNELSKQEKQRCWQKLPEDNKKFITGIMK